MKGRVEASVSIDGPDGGRVGATRSIVGVLEVDLDYEEELGKGCFWNNKVIPPYKY